ncbi:MAG: zinc metallopeptidase [Thiohalocapsa sp.]
MHAAFVLVPILAASFGPRLWANHLLRRHDQLDPRLPPAHLLARKLLDRDGLALVRVELTDMGDHYDPRAKAVRLNRARYERRSLSAAAAAAHEVGHALQDAAGYLPFRLHLGLARAARVSGDVGTVLLIGIPVAAMLAKGPIPPMALGVAAVGMLGTSLAARLAALPAELDASLRRALPALRGHVDDDGLRDARRILLVCSLTYVSSSLNPLMVIWPWVGGPLRRPLPGLRADRQTTAVRGFGASEHNVVIGAEREAKPLSTRPASRWTKTMSNQSLPIMVPARRPRLGRQQTPRSLLKALVRPWVRAWLRVTGDY